MKRRRVCVGLTGGTGLVGQHLMFEYLRMHREDPSTLHFVIFGRDSLGHPLKSRIGSLIRRYGIEYAGLAPHFDVDAFLDDHTTFVSADMGRPDLGISNHDLLALGDRTIDVFYHIASQSDFRTTSTVRDALWRNNVAGTRALLDLLDKLDIAEINYVSSAYVCGNSSGLISPDETHFPAGHRNHYETTKLVAEIDVCEYACAQDIPLRVFRPSVISGRLMEPVIGHTCKFDVFYAFAGFCYFLKKRFAERQGLPFEQRMSIPMRVPGRADSGLNIVPVDYVAKAMVHITEVSGATGSFHLVNKQDAIHAEYISRTLDLIGIDGAEIVPFVPSDPNAAERQLLRSVANVLAPYTLADPMVFAHERTDLALRGSGIECPLIDERAFEALMQFAIDREFGRIETVDELPAAAAAAVLAA